MLKRKGVRKSLKALWKMYLPLRLPTLITVLIGGVRVAASLAFVWNSKMLVDIATGTVDASLKTHIYLMCAIMVLQLLTGLGASWWESYITIKTQNRMRHEIFGYVLGSRWNGKEKFLSGDTVNGIQDDIKIVADILCSRIPNLIITILQFVVFSGYLLRMAPYLFWVLLILSIIMAFSARLFFFKRREISYRVRAEESAIQQHMQENLQNRLVVLTISSVSNVLGRLRILQRGQLRLSIKGLNLSAFSRGVMQAGFFTGYMVAFFWGIYGIRGGTVTYGMMTAFLQLVGQVQRPIAEIGRQFTSFINVLTSVDRLVELKQLPQEKESEQQLLPGAPAVEVKNLSFSYEGQSKLVIENFSKLFPAGDMSVILGETGTGKSTLIKLILGLLKPNEGEIVIGGEPAGVHLMCNFMYIPQGNTLMSGTIRHNLLLANPNGSEELMRHALRMAEADFVFSTPDGLDTVCGEVGSGLSEGQSQRIAIARALMKDGGILILDEATSALDEKTETALLQNLAREYKGKKTIIFISHRKKVVEFADQIITLK